MRTSSRRSRALAAQALIALVVSAVVLAGVWIAGGRITDGFIGSVLLTGAWFAMSGATILGLTIARRRLRPGLVADTASRCSPSAPGWAGR